MIVMISEKEVTQNSEAVKLSAYCQRPLATQPGQYSDYSLAVSIRRQ